MSMKGYMGKILRVNLISKETTVESLNFDWARDFIGGSGLGVRMAYDEVPPDTDPLGPESKLFIMTGPVTGTTLGTSGRYQVIFKSPLTGMLCDSSSSGHWGTSFKKCGYDGIVIEGKSETPVYLYVTDDSCEIRDAGSYWGLDSVEVQKKLIGDVQQSKAKVLTIGPAGERQVIFASIMNDESRAAARGGPGAVMGSKNLKAIVAYGTKAVELHDPGAYKKAAVEINKKNAEELEGMTQYGTISVHDDRWAISDIPVKNWSLPSSEEINSPIGGFKLREIMPFNTNSCHMCTIRCARWVKIEEGPYKFEGAGPEYESSAALGCLCMNMDIEAMSYANHLCNLYGMDTITTGATIAFMMECYEKGYITKEELDGIDLTWGNKEGMIELIKKIGNAEEGAGKLLGLGTKRLAEKIGKDSMDFAVQVKGLELPMHDARTRFSWASNYATASRGGCHLHGMTDTWEDAEDPLPEWDFMGKIESQSDENKGMLTYLSQAWGHIRDSLVMCHFATVIHQPSIFSDLLYGATGQKVAPKEFITIGDRINNLHRVYNNRCGITSKDDTMPKRAMTPLKGGGADGLVPDLERQLKEYYELRGWEKDGRPSKKTLQDLGLEFAIQDIY